MGISLFLPTETYPDMAKCLVFSALSILLFYSLGEIIAPFLIFDDISTNQTAQVPE